MDIEFGGEAHEAAIAKVLKVSKAKGKKAAIFCEFQDGSRSDELKDDD